MTWAASNCDASDPAEHDSNAEGGSAKLEEQPKSSGELGCPGRATQASKIHLFALGLYVCLTGKARNGHCLPHTCVRRKIRTSASTGRCVPAYGD